MRFRLYLSTPTKTIKKDNIRKLEMAANIQLRKSISDLEMRFEGIKNASGLNGGINIDMYL